MIRGYTGDPTNNQAVFDFVLGFITKQGKRAATSNGGCYYRTTDGDCCAAGCLIPDEDYVKAFEGYSVDGPCGGGPTDYFRQRGFNLSLLKAMQQCHDMTTSEDFVAEFQTKMAGVANASELTFTKPA
jgi:hypothetical protein